MTRSVHLAAAAPHMAAIAKMGRHRRRRGQPVEAAEIKATLSEAVSRMGSALNSLPDGASQVIRKEVDEVRR
jgi:hypothetical protein